MRARRDLRLLATAVLLSAAGDFIALLALVVRVHDTSGSGFAVSALFAATMAPVVLLAPLAGLLVDRVETVRLIAVVSALQAVVAVALVPSHGLGLTLGLVALLGAGATISQAAEAALVPAVAGERLTEANGVVETARYIGFTAGPIVGGALAAAGGTGLALAVNAVSFAAVALGSLAIRTRRRPVAVGPAGPTGSARDGVALLCGDRLLRVVVGSATAALVFLSISMTAEVFYVTDVVGAGAAGLGAVLGAWTIGMIAGARVIAARAARRELAAAALAALAVQGAGMALGASWALLPLVMAGFAVGGIGHGAKNVLVRTLIGERAPARLHGRVFAAYNAARNAAELGALGAGGALVALIGAQPALLIAGLGTVALATAGLLVLSGRVPEAVRSASGSPG